jgi:Zn-dependent protease with chaperone function
MAKQKYIWTFVSLPILLSLMFFLLGDTKWAIIALGLIPLFFICWGLSILLSGQRLREIEHHMTETERQQFNELAKTYGIKVGLFFSVPMGATYFILSYIIGVKNYAYYIVAFGVFFLIWLPFGLWHRKKMIRFALSTEYAKEKGWDKELD